MMFLLYLSYRGLLSLEGCLHVPAEKEYKNKRNFEEVLISVTVL